ncbi:MAG: right-handed parallel beta-helix repeat-containing protein, partial [Myxococcota bacterium]
CAPAPSGCNLDGDGRPSLTCAGGYGLGPGNTKRYATAADSVRCVCSLAQQVGGVCGGDALCSGANDGSYTTLGAAWTAIPAGAFTTPTFIILWSGTHAGDVTMSGSGRTPDAANRLYVGARCAAGVRDAVIVDTPGAAYLIELRKPYTTIEGLRLDTGTSTTAKGIYLTGEFFGEADNVALRHLTITGSGAGSPLAYLSCDGGVYDLDNVLVEEVDVYGNDTATYSQGIRMRRCLGFTIRRTAVCDLESGYVLGDLGYSIDGTSLAGTIERSLALRADQGIRMEGGGTLASLTVDGVHARNNADWGLWFEQRLGLTVRNSRFLSNGNLTTEGGVHLQNSDESLFFNNLFAANSGYGMRAINAAAGAGGAAPWNHSFEFNTFAGNGTSGIYLDGAAGFLIDVPSFRGNLFVDQLGAGVGVSRDFANLAASASENRYNNNVGGNCTCTGTPVPACATATQCLETGDGTPNVNPLHVSAAGKLLPYYLDQITPSPVKDLSALTSVAAGLSARTTKTTGTGCSTAAADLDVGNADLGYHYESCLCEPGEVCDGADTNGVAGIDEGCDNDADGYCEFPTGAYARAAVCTNTAVGAGGNDCCDANGTCNDGGAVAASSINTGASESCDNFDNECDGAPDDGCDDDNDNRCDIVMSKLGGVSVTTCTGTPIAATVGDDCNDATALMSPALAEICGTPA